jgi:hypothetical protein
MAIDKDEFRRRESIVIEEFGGIIGYCEPFYVYSIHYSADRAIAAFERFIEAASSPKPNAPLVVASIHEALSHTAALSRFFWPSRDKGIHEARAKKLRHAFNVKGDSPLKDRALRDALEHFDERLDKFLLENEAGHFRPAPTIGNLSEITELDRLFKLVDLDRKAFVILNEVYFFEPIIVAASDIMMMAIRMAKEEHL